MPTSIFTDDTGRRSVRARWAVRVVSATLLVGAAVTALSLFTHVSLPSLPNPVSGHSDAAVQKPKPSNKPTPSAAAPTTPPTSATTSAPTTSGTDETPRSLATTRAPTPTTTTTASTGRSTDAPRAVPTHDPGTPPVVPPGKAK